MRSSLTFWPRTFRNRLLVLFVLLACIAVAVNIKFLIEVTDEMAAQGRAVLSQTSEQQHESTGKPNLLLNCRNRLLISLGVLIACFASILYLLVTRVVTPLAGLVNVAAELSKGNLSASVPNCAGNEIGEMGAVLNGIAADFQEVVLLTGATVGNSVSAVEKIEKLLEQGDSADRNDLKFQVDSIKKDLDTLSKMVKEFRFYHVHFDGRKVVPHGPGNEM